MSQPEEILTFLRRKDERTGYILRIGSFTYSLSLLGYGNGDIEL